MYQAITRYYFIPLLYKVALASQIDAWLASSPTAWVVVTPAKYTGTSLVDLPSGIQDMTGADIMENSIVFGNLLGFCLKDELDEATHLFALSLDGVMAFDTSQDYLEFIENL